MCIEEKPEIWIAGDPIRAWKVVTFPERQSRWLPEKRAILFRWEWLSDYYESYPFVRGHGELFTYPVGANVRSIWPGIFCLVNWLEPDDFENEALTVIKVEIPTGTEFVKGTSQGRETICAQVVKVLT